MARTSSLAVARESEVERYFRPGTALHRVVLEAAYLARCSDDKTAALVRPIEYALRYPYLQANRKGRVSWLIFDLDHANPWVWEDAGLPPPNLIVSDRDSCRAHLYYAIVPVCTTEKGRSQPIEFMRAVYEAMARHLKADQAYRQGAIAKTPGHAWWRTAELHAREYTLGDLAEYVDLARPSPWAKGPRLEAAAGSRHCTLFELARYYAYSIVDSVREKGSYERFLQIIEAYCLNHVQRVSNVAGKPHELLTWAQMRATAKSIARWTWDKYNGRSDGVHRGAMALDKALPLNERQRLAAERTHGLRTKATESRIRAACRQLQEAGQAIAQNALARATGLTRQTIAAYKHVIEEVLQTAVAPVAQLAVAPESAVKFAVHQISAPSGRGNSVSQLPLIDDDPWGLPEPVS